MCQATHLLPLTHSLCLYLSLARVTNSRRNKFRSVSCDLRAASHILSRSFINRPKIESDGMVWSGIINGDTAQGGRDNRLKTGATHCTCNNGQLATTANWLTGCSLAQYMLRQKVPKIRFLFRDYHGISRAECNQLFNKKLKNEFQNLIRN